MYIGKKHIIFAVVGAPLAAILFAWIGFFNVGASSGHWAITNWFLHFAMRQAVSTYALPIERPEVIDEALLAPAAGHFAQACVMCHGAPGESRSSTVLQMLPRPPELTAAVDSWSDEELFRIVKHGIRFTGMPAWTTQTRDDEVWGMVSFLRKLPNLDEQGYAQLTQSQPVHNSAVEAGEFETALQRCASCHGADGSGRSSAVPVLGGQDEAYLLASLQAYAQADRASGIMETAATLADVELYQELATYFAAQPGLGKAAEGQFEPANEALRAGQIIAEAGIPSADVPACLSCHGERRNPVFPVLDGQHRDYIVRQLELFASGERGGTPYNHLMVKAVKGLNDDQRRAVAAYFEARGR